MRRRQPADADARRVPEQETAADAARNAVYTFAGDTAKGQANGEGIKSLGGTWHTWRPR